MFNRALFQFKIKKAWGRTSIKKRLNAFVRVRLCLAGVHGHERLVTFMFNQTNVVAASTRFQEPAVDEAFMFGILLVRPSEPFAKLNILSGLDRWEVDDIYEHVSHLPTLSTDADTLSVFHSYPL